MSNVINTIIGDQYKTIQLQLIVAPILYICIDFFTIFVHLGCKIWQFSEIIVVLVLLKTCIVGTR